MGRGQSPVKAEEVRDETSDVRGSRGSPRDGSGLPIFIPSGNGIQAGSEDVNGGTKIGEVGPHITDSRRSDGDRLLSVGRRGPPRVIVIVSSGCDDGNTAVVKLNTKSFVNGVAVMFHPLNAYRFNSLIHGTRKTTIQVHRSNRGFAGHPRVFDDPEHTIDTVFR